jgi:transposase
VLGQIRPHNVEAREPIGREGLDRLRTIVADTDNGRRVPAEARASLEMLAMQLEGVKAQIVQNDRRIIASARATEVGRRLLEVPGIGPVLASAFVARGSDYLQIRARSRSPESGLPYLLERLHDDASAGSASRVGDPAGEAAQVVFGNSARSCCNIFLGCPGALITMSFVLRIWSVISNPSER